MNYLNTGILSSPSDYSPCNLRWLDGLSEEVNQLLNDASVLRYRKVGQAKLATFITVSYGTFSERVTECPREINVQVSARLFGP